MKRRRKLEVRLSDGELAQVQARARKEGVTASALVRGLFFGEAPERTLMTGFVPERVGDILPVGTEVGEHPLSEHARHETAAGKPLPRSPETGFPFVGDVVDLGKAWDEKMRKVTGTKAKARTQMCPHRVPVGAYCKRCAS